MDGSPASILVVSNPTDAPDITGALGGEVTAPGGGPTVALAVATCDGGDATLGRFVEARPEVVLVTASLDAGDARALIAAMRGAAPAGTFSVILIGDPRGPIRNALDAADFAPDRFVVRPLAAKAVRYAVATGIAAARRARAAAGAAPSAAPEAVLPEPTATRVTGTHRAAMVVREGRAATVPPPAPVAPASAATSPRLDAMLDAAVDEVVSEEVVRRTSGGFAVPVEAILAAGGSLDDGITRAPDDARAAADLTAPQSVHDVPTRPVGALEQRRIHAVDPVTIQPRRAQTRPRFGAGTVAPVEPAGAWEAPPRPVPPPPDPVPHADPDAPGDAPAVTSSVALAHDDSGSFPLPPGIEAPVVSETEGSFDGGDGGDDAAAAWPASGTQDLPRDDDWDVMSPVPVREPTLILSERELAQPPEAARAVATAPQLDVTERHSGGRWASAPSVRAMADEAEDRAAQPAAADDGAADDDEVVEDHLDADLSDLSISRPIATPAATDPDVRPPTGGDFARELRRKMSEMAQRLFRPGAPGAPADGPASVDVRPPHDFRTEIDLAALEGGAAGSGTDLYALDGDVTFAGDDHGLPAGAPAADTPGQGAGTSTGIARTSESGEIQRGGADAAALIARMFTAEFTGNVVFRRDAPGAAEPVEKVIYFDGGRPVFAASNHPADRMGELLYREGKITAEQYAGCRDLVSESGRRMGEILVDKGYLKRRELLPAVRRHVEDIIYSLFAWDTGEYRIVPGDGAQQERIRLSRHPAAMVLEGVRRKLDLPTLERLLGPPTTVVEVADRDKAGTVIAVADLSPDERAALAGMDGSADLGHVARTSGASLLAVYQLAWAMSLLGVATMRRRGVEDDDAPALVGETDLAIDRERVRARHRLVSEADYFALLGVRRDATGFEIRRAYENARRDFDADAFPPELRTELGVELAEIGAVLDEAYRVLRDDRLRGDYLAHLAE